MNTFTLHYFTFNGRAAVPRAILCYSKIPFENITIDKEKEWPSLKYNGTYEFNQVPILIHNGKTLSQSMDRTLFRKVVWIIW